MICIVVAMFGLAGAPAAWAQSLDLLAVPSGTMTTGQTYSLPGYTGTVTVSWQPLAGSTSPSVPGVDGSAFPVLNNVTFPDTPPVSLGPNVRMIRLSPDGNNRHFRLSFTFVGAAPDLSRLHLIVNNIGGGNNITTLTPSVDLTMGGNFAYAAAPTPIGIMGGVIRSTQLSGATTNTGAANLRIASSVTSLPGQTLSLDVYQNGNDQIAVSLAYRTAPATITIVKDADPNDATDFPFTSNLSGVPTFSLDDDSNGTLPNSRTFTVSAGTMHQFTETVVPGWTLQSITCTGPGADTSTVPGRSVSVLLIAGQSETCIFRNRKVPDAPLPGTITIIKDAAPNDAQDFGFSANSPNIPAFLLDDDNNGTLSNSKVFTVPSGTTYTFTEAAVPGWTLTGISCTGGGGPGQQPSWLLQNRSLSVPLAPGQNVVCTFTNTRATQHEVRIIKDATINNAQDFAFTGSGPNFSQSFTLDDDSGAPGADQTYNSSMAFVVGAGSFTFQEGALPQGWGLLSINCNPANAATTDLANRRVTVQVAGTTPQTVTCTFVNRGGAICQGYPLAVDVNLFNPGWNVVHICRGGTVTFRKTTGNGFTVTPTTPAGSFTPVPLGAGTANGTTTAFPTPGTYFYQTIAAVPAGQIVVH
ncbi:hypothetical protein [Brevundimonas sp.]|uniref:prealbumin-like fold domain-containing protein n=1 Tax=Brevundimonas sp. TaxID=1871086 RepID=UPI0026259A66|nr:hypothetical protein [Brevundimonas sp.]